MRALLACHARGGVSHRLLAGATPKFRPFQSARRRDRLHGVRPAAQQQQVTASGSAAQSVEQGLSLFEKGEYQAALPLFLKAQQQNPNDDEARAALYNAACAYTKLRQWEAAADAVVDAVNDYNLKLSVALNDPDLEALRERREWVTALNKVKGGLTDKQYVKLRSEAKAPFRLARMFLFGSLAGGAALGLVIITTKLVAALQGNGDLQETLQNFSINSAALAVFSFLLYRDYSQLEKDKRVVEREESLGKLQVAMDDDRVLPLAAFRGTTRPVIIAGTKGQVNRAIQAAEPLKEELRERGVSVVPIILSQDDPQARLRKLKQELSGELVPSALEPEQPSKGFGSDAKKVAKPTQQMQLTKKDKRWQLEAANLPEWVTWLAEQKTSASVADGNTVYVQIQLDGSVRASGVGNPPWRQFVMDLPEVSSVRTKLSDGGAFL